MVVLWITLFFLHPVYTMVPVEIVELGKPAFFTCVLPKELSTREIHWYKQSVGDILNVIVTLWKTTEPEYAPGFPKSRFGVRSDDSFSNLTIMRTVKEDEGMYHCAFTEWIKTKWSATYLIVKGNTESSSNYTVAQWPIASDPVRPGDSVTLQCSVLSDSENKTCPGDLNVFWFRAGSHPDILYTDGDTSNECERRSDTQKRCVYSFSKDISSSDDGTYYCAVATCGEILFGNGTKVNVQESSMCSKMDSAVNLILCAALAMSLIVIVGLLCTITEKQCEPCKAADVLQKNCDGQKNKQEEPWIYSAVVFTAMKADSGTKKAAEKKRIYTAIKALGLD